MMISWLLALALSASAVAGSAPGAPSKESKPMEWKGQHGGPPEPGHLLITDAKRWKALWRGLGAEAPALDFKTHAAVAVFAGERPTGGWSIAFQETPRGADMLVSYTIRRPTGFTTQAFTAPWAARAVRRPKGKVLPAEAKEE